MIILKKNEERRGMKQKPGVASSRWSVYKGKLLLLGVTTFWERASVPSAYFEYIIPPYI